MLERMVILVCRAHNLYKSTHAYTYKYIQNMHTHACTYIYLLLHSNVLVHVSCNSFSENYCSS